MGTMMNSDKILIGYAIQKTGRGKFIVYGLSTDFIKQGDYVNVILQCENKNPDRILCGFVRRIYYGQLANSELPMSFPGEEHTYLIITDELYLSSEKYYENFRLLTEAENSGLFSIVVEFISKAKSIMSQKGKSLPLKISELKKESSEVIKKIKEQKTSETIKRKIIDKITKLVNFFTQKGKQEEQKQSYFNI